MSARESALNVLKNCRAEGGWVNSSLKEQLARDEVLRQLRITREGGITEQELKAAKEALLSSLRSTHDSPGAIEGYYSTAALSGLIFSHSEYMKAVEEATTEDVVKCANSLTLHTTYFLKGGSQ